MQQLIVNSVNDYINKYGTQTTSLLVAKLINDTSKFDGDTNIAKELGVMMADLETALRNHAQ